MTNNLNSSIDMSLRQRAAWFSLLTSFVVFSLKAFAYYRTHSTAVLSDALETIVNIIAAIVALVVIKYVSQPADEDHPYGHGKVEYFSAAFEGGLIFFAALVILIEGVKALISGSLASDLQEGLIYVGAASLCNLILGLYLRKIAHEQKSETLAASSAHVISDVVTTGAVLVGLGLVMLTGWTWLDPVMAIVVALHLGWESWQIVRRSFAGLIDEIDISSLDPLVESLSKNKQIGIINIHNLKVIRAGSFHHVDAHLVVPEFWDVGRVHELSNQYEHLVVKDYPFDGEIAFHVDPCHSKYCDICELADCPFRKEKYQSAVEFKVKDLIKGPRRA